MYASVGGTVCSYPIGFIPFIEREDAHRFFDLLHVEHHYITIDHGQVDDLLSSHQSGLSAVILQKKQ
jgi:hypothetical protein